MSYPVASGFRATILLGLILVGYLVILLATSMLVGPHATSLRLLSTNTWLAVASLLFWLQRPMSLTLVKNSQRVWLGAAVTLTALGLLWPYVLWWPGGASEFTLAQAFVLVLIVPVAEELYFRGILLDHLRDQMGPVGAVLPVCALFGFLHYPHGMQWVMAGLSLVLCAVVLISRSISWAIALHILWNAAAMVRTTVPGQERWILAGVATLAAMVLIVAGLVYRDRDAAPIRMPLGLPNGDG